MASRLLDGRPNSGSLDLEAAPGILCKTDTETSRTEVPSASKVGSARDSPMYMAPHTAQRDAISDWTEILSRVASIAERQMT